MLTETWALEYDPVLPARWNPKAVPAPLVVYLDQWCFDHLARDRAGRPLDPSEQGTFAYFRSLALSGKVVFVLSQMHYIENWVRSNEDARWDHAVTMAELSGFNTISPTGLAYWEAFEAVAAFCGTDAEMPVPDVFGWGLAHCLRGVEGTAQIIDTRTGRPATWEGLPEETRARYAALEEHAAARFELALLARRDPRMEPELLPFAPVPDDGRGALLVQEELDIAAAIDELGRSEDTVRLVVEGRCFVDQATWLNVNTACLVQGLGPDAVTNLLGVGTSGENRKALTAFMKCMPLQGRYAELRVQSHLNPGRKRKPSDGRDYFALASVSPFVDYMVVDKSMSILAVDAGFDRLSGATVLRRLADLRDRLEHDVDPDE